jgi:hypothetical protein
VWGKEHYGDNHCGENPWQTQVIELGACCILTTGQHVPLEHTCSDKARLLTMKQSHSGIEITARSTGTVSGVKRKAPEEGHSTLGFQISGYGKCTAQKKAMKEKAILFGESIRISTMWIGESGMAYNAFYMPSLVYGTPAATLTKKDCEEIQRPVVNAILPKMGIARTAPRAVVFGTAQFGGLGLTHITALQGHNLIQYLLGNLHCGDATGCLMQMLL